MARARAQSRGRLGEFLGLAAFALAILITVSLLSFHPHDRSFGFAPSSLAGPTRNLAGAIGANLSYALYLALGIPAWLLPALLIGVGARRLRGNRGPLDRLRLAGACLLWLSVSALLAVSLVSVRFRGLDGGIQRTVPVPAGGVVGTAVASLLGGWLNEAGSLIVLLTMLATALLLTTSVSYAQLLDRSIALAQKLRSALDRAWLRLQEHRRAAAERGREQAKLRAQREKEALKRREADLKRLEVESRAAEKASRERDKVRREEERLRAESSQMAEEIARKEREIAEVARLASQPRKAEAPRAGLRAVTPASPIPAGAKLAEAAEQALLRGRQAPAGPPRAPLSQEALARAVAVTRKLDEAPAAVAPLPLASPAPPAGALPPAPRPDPTISPRGPGAQLSLPRLDPTPRDFASLAAEASDAVRKAREARAEAKAEAEGRKKAERRARTSDFALPPITLLETVNNDAMVTERELVENAKVLVSKLKEFDVDGTVQAIHPGPVVTTYEYRPEAGVKYSKIVGLADDLCLAMKAEGVRIDRISGKSAVGIEVPNSARETIGLKEILETDEFTKSASRLTFALGKSISGDTYVTDLRKMPHLLVAGATGSGKSVAVNCMIVSILYKATPQDVRFIMVDPKRIELGVYDGIPHLLVPVVTDCRLASNALRWAVVEMENRYKRLASTGVRSLEQYNTYLKGPESRKLAEHMSPEELEPLPHIVILIDELADLMMVAANDVEDSISRLAAMARAVGIHLVLATQRPSVDVITGVIKANFPSRISFRVSSKVDSRTILDSNGAEMLLGKGDMLFMPPGSARLQRVHGAFISDGEVQRLVSYLKNQQTPEYRDDVLKAPEPEKEEGMEAEYDEMYEDAVRVVLETGQASVSHLQRRLRLGYGRAARLVDMMEMNGIVGPSQGAKGREILVDRAGFLARMGEEAVAES